MKKQFLIQQILILTPLSFAAVFLVAQLVSPSSDNTSNTTTQSVQAPLPAPSARGANPSGGTSNPPPPSPPPALDPGDPFSGGGGNPGGAPGGAVPVDGGLSLLLAAGVGYGVKKAYNSRKHKVKAEN